MRLLACDDMDNESAWDGLHLFQENLRTFASIIHLYRLLPGATVSTRILMKSLTSLCLGRSQFNHSDRYDRTPQDSIK